MFEKVLFRFVKEFLMYLMLIFYNNRHQILLDQCWNLVGKEPSRFVSAMEAPVNFYRTMMKLF